MIALLRRGGIFLGSTAVAFLLGIVLAPILLVPFGFRSATVMSGSMTPTLEMGDIVIERPIAPAAARVGDVITFSDPNDKDRLITHRVRSMSVTGDEYTFETKGDANNTTEEWHIGADGTIGRVALSVPKVGFLLGSGRGPWVRISFVLLPALVWAVYELVTIWRPGRRRLAGEPEPGIS